MWNLSRKLILKIFLQTTKDYANFKVPTITLDSFTRKKKIKLIDILKIDVDGFEYNLLKGAERFIKKGKVKIILIEINGKTSNYKKKEKKIISFLEKYEFRLIKKQMMLSVSMFSKLKAGDYLFVNSRYFEV